MEREPRRLSGEEQLALLVSSAADYAMFMLDPVGVVKTWNPGAARLMGYSEEEATGRHFSLFYTEDDKARDHPNEELRIASRDGRYEEEGWRVRKDGSRFWANTVITAIRDDRGELIGFGKVSRDLTARRLTEEQTRARALELEAANRQLGEFRRLVSSVRDYAIFMLDPAGHIMSWNTGARHLKGYEPEEIIGRHFSTFYTADDRARNHPSHELEIAVREGRYEEEGWRVRKDGTTFWASVTITAVRDEEGRLTGFAKVTRDLTERKRTEDALQQAVEELQRANEELDRFASVAAHDMTDPLRTISGFAEMLVHSELAPEQAEEFAQHILDSSLRLTAMLRGLLGYARAGRSSVESEPINVARVVEQVRNELAASIAERGARVALDVPDDASVIADGHDLHAVLQNLLSNAVKFSDPDRPVISVTGQPDADAWCFTVEDNGPGIRPEDQDAIFDAFARVSAHARSSGYGLGLAICARLVERHGGRIGVESVPGEGSRFWVRLPAAAGGSTAPPQHSVGGGDAPLPV